MALHDRINPKKKKKSGFATLDRADHRRLHLVAVTVRRTRKLYITPREPNGIIRVFTVSNLQPALDYSKCYSSVEYRRGQLCPLLLPPARIHQTESQEITLQLSTASYSSPVATGIPKKHPRELPSDREPSAETRSYLDKLSHHPTGHRLKCPA